MINIPSGLPNTVFTVLDPTASKYLVRPSRTPFEAFPGSENDPQLFATALDKFASEYKSLSAPTVLPTVANIRLGLNVAACDNRPIALVFTKSTLTDVVQKLTALSWEEKFMGKFTYVITNQTADLKKIGSALVTEGIYFAAPDAYGTLAVSIGFAAASATSETIASEMAKALIKFRPLNQEDHIGHLQRGVRQGIRWIPAIPEEDPRGAEATRRLWGGV